MAAPISPGRASLFIKGSTRRQAAALKLKHHQACRPQGFCEVKLCSLPRFALCTKGEIRIQGV